MPFSHAILSTPSFTTTCRRFIYLHTQLLILNLLNTYCPLCEVNISQLSCYCLYMVEFTHVQVLPIVAPHIALANISVLPLLCSPVSIGDCSLVRTFCSPKVRKSEIKGSSFGRFCSPKVRKSDNEIHSYVVIRLCSPKVLKSEIKVL